MYIDQPDASSHQAESLDEQEQFIVFHHCDAWQRMEERADLLPVAQVAPGKFAEDERVYHDRIRLEKRGESAVRSPEVVNPNGRIHEYHYAVLRRGMGLTFGSEPPRAAKRCAL